MEPVMRYTIAIPSCPAVNVFLGGATPACITMQIASYI